MTDLIVGAGWPRVQFTANGSQTVFTFPFPILAASEIAVWFGDGGAPTSHVVTGVGETAGGNVTFAVAPPAGTRITVLRVMPIARSTDFQEAGEFRAIAINEELDRLVMMVQQVDERASRAAQLPPTAGPANTDLPGPAPGFIRWNDAGDALVLDQVPQVVADAAAASAAASAASAGVAATSAASASTSASIASAAASSATASATGASGSAAAAAASAAAGVISAADAAASAATVDMPTERQRSDLANIRERIRIVLNSPTAPQPSFGMDFVQGLGLDSLTFSRAGTATWFDAAGTMRTAAANEPRYDHDPRTGAPLGLLVEAARTNIVWPSNDFTHGNWDAAGDPIAVTAAQEIGPDRSATLSRLAATGGYDRHVATNSLSAACSAGTTYTLSCYARKGTADWIYIGDNGDAALHGAFFNLSTGVVGATEGTLAAKTIKDCGSGLYRVAVTFVRSNAGFVHAAIGPAPADSTAVYTPAGTAEAIHAGFVQVESSLFPTSAIATATAGVLRNTDIASVASLGPWFNPAEFTFLVEFMLQGIDLPNSQSVIRCEDTIGNNNAALLARYFGTSNARWFSKSAGVDDGDFVAGSLSDTEAVHRGAMRVAANDLAGSLNGSGAVGDNSVAMPSDLSRISLGSYNLGASPLQGWLRRVVHFPRRLTDSQLQVLST